MKSRLKGLLALTLSLVMMLSMVTVGWGSVNAQGIHVCDTADCLVCDVADKINALPAKNDITVNNAAAVTEQIHAIDRVKVDLTDDQYDELLTVVATRQNSSGYGLDEPVRYMEAVEKVTSLNAGGSLYVQKKYSVGSVALDWEQSNATLTIECLDAGSSFAPLSVTMADVEGSSLSSFYSANADGWTNRYILPAGTYKITETDYHAVTTDGTSLTTTASYSVDGNAVSNDYAVVTVEEGGSYTVMMTNSTSVRIGDVMLLPYKYYVKNSSANDGDPPIIAVDEAPSDNYAILEDDILTLKNFKLTTTSGDSIHSNSDLTINLSGSNEVTSTAVAGNSGGVAVFINGNLRITSQNNGSLAAGSENYNGISAHNITIDKADLTVGCLYGLNAAHGTGTVTISNGSKLTINATTAAISGTLNLNDDVNNGGSLWYQWTTTNGGTPNTSKLLYNGEKYLKIEPITYTVTYANGGGVGTDPTQTSTAAGGTFTLAQNPYTKSGYTFAGWNDGANTYAAGATYTMPANDVILTAQWTENSAGGPSTPQPPTYYPIYIPTVEDEPEVTAPKTFDGGIVSAVVVSILSATGGAWLAKKKD